MLVNGKWVEKWQPVQAKDAKGGFVRQTSGFRSWVTPDGASGPSGSGGFAAEAGRYHLMVALICPWASRTLMARALKGLEEVVSVSIVAPELTDQGWHFPQGPEPVTGIHYMHELYTRADSTYSGRATVPVLWDRQSQTIVSNESAEILRMFNAGFGDLARGPDLYPEPLRDGIDQLNDWIYPRFNNGVYRAGFATTQAAYDEAVAEVFQALAQLETRMSDGRTWLMGDTFTEADIRAFVTAVRFDAAYHGLFKTNLKRFADHPRLQAWMERVLALPGVAPTVNIAHIKRGYASIRAINPLGLVPAGPDLPWYQPHPDLLGQAL